MQNRSNDEIEDEITEEIFKERFLVPEGIHPCRITGIGDIKELSSGKGFYVPIGLKVDGYKDVIAHAVGWMPAITMIIASKPFFIGKIVDAKFRTLDYIGRKYNDVRPIWNTLRELD